MQDPISDNDIRPSLADAMNAIMSDPSIISTALAALKNSSSAASAQSVPTQEPPQQVEPEDKDEESKQVSTPVGQDTSELMRNLAPMLSMLTAPRSSAVSKEADSRAALLVALRPYLSESRREAIDYIIKISQVSDLIKKASRP